MNWWNALLLWLASLFALPIPVDVEHAKSAAAVAAARASMEVAAPQPQPAPDPKPKPKVCPDCNNTGWITHGDGHKTRCPCGIQPTNGGIIR